MISRAYSGTGTPNLSVLEQVVVGILTAVIIGNVTQASLFATASFHFLIELIVIATRTDGDWHPDTPAQE